MYGLQTIRVSCVGFRPDFYFLRKIKCSLPDLFVILLRTYRGSSVIHHSRVELNFFPTFTYDLISSVDLA